MPGRPAKTPQRLKFIEVFEGNAAAAARLSGFKHSEIVGPRLLKVPWIAEAIRAREIKEVRPLIATRQLRQKFWSDVMQDDKSKMPDRLKASELLGKSEADFTENLKLNIYGTLAEDIKHGRERATNATNGDIAGGNTAPK